MDEQRVAAANTACDKRIFEIRRIEREKSPILPKTCLFKPRSDALFVGRRDHLVKITLQQRPLESLRSFADAIEQRGELLRTSRSRCTRHRVVARDHAAAFGAKKPMKKRLDRYRVVKIGRRFNATRAQHLRRIAFGI